MKKKTTQTTEALIAEYKIPKCKESGDLQVIRRLLALPMNQRIHFLRWKRQNGGSHI